MLRIHPGTCGKISILACLARHLTAEADRRSSGSFPSDSQLLRYLMYTTEFSLVSLLFLNAWTEIHSVLQSMLTSFPSQLAEASSEQL